MPDSPRHPPARSERDWLDPQHHFYRDEDGTARFARGPHRGEPVEDHVTYLQAMLDQPFEEETKQAVRRLLFELGQRFW